MIKRRKDYSKGTPSKTANKIYIVCEGKGTEPKYFDFFENLSSNLKLIVIPPEEGTDPLKLLGLAKRSFYGDARKFTLDYLQQDKVWFVIDTDTWQREGKIAPLREFCKKQNDAITKECDEAKTYAAWNVAQSNPCFEVWLYYHIYDSIPDETIVREFSSVKDFVDKQIAGGFDFQRDPVRLQDAIENSGKNFLLQDNGNLDWFATEVFKLGNEIMAFVHAEICKLKNKIG